MDLFLLLLLLLLLQVFVYVFAFAAIASAGFLGEGGDSGGWQSGKFTNMCVFKYSASNKSNNVLSRMLVFEGGSSGGSTKIIKGEFSS